MTHDTMIPPRRGLTRPHSILRSPSSEREEEKQPVIGLTNSNGGIRSASMHTDIDIDTVTATVTATAIVDTTTNTCTNTTMHSSSEEEEKPDAAGVALPSVLHSALSYDEDYESSQRALKFLDKRSISFDDTLSFADGFDDDDEEEPLSMRSDKGGGSIHGSIHHRRGRRDFDFLNDTPESMTYSRRIAIHLMKYPWYYNPRKQLNNQTIEESEELQSANDAMSKFSLSLHKSTTFRKASLKKAWAYFEHVTLPRYICKEDDERCNKALLSRSRIKSYVWKQLKRRSEHTMQRADPGEMHKFTKLYSPLYTPIERMGDFGLGTGLYFTSIRALIIMTFVLGLLNIPNMLYFSSDEYTGGGGADKVPWYLVGSAICTRTSWVPCPNCNITGQWGDNMDRIANTTTDDGKNVLIFALRNECDGAKIQLARINFVTIIVLVIGLVALGSYQQTWETRFNEGKETARDYSIVVKNPPESASDPDEWKLYFERTFRAKVALVTIGIDNDLLIRTLVQRREVLRRLELALDPGISLDVLSLAKISSKIEQKRNSWQWLFHLFVPGIPEMFGRLTVLTARVQGLAQQNYIVRHVFVTFEKVSTRQRILNEFALGNLAIYGWMKSVTLNKGYLFFRGELLKVKQPDEAATIRWQDLNAKVGTRLLQLAFTNLIGLGGTALIAFLITVFFKVNYLFGAGFIALSNMLYAEFAKKITFMFESHFAEGDVQASIYVKVGLFRFVNTAIILTITTPFTSQLEVDGLIPRVYAVFVAELILVPLARLIDFPGHFRRHVLAPRALTQDGMNLNFVGHPVELAERVTDLTKMVFLSFWYSAVFPGGLFFCSFVLFAKYYTDRFGLMRIWKRVLPVGNRIELFSRRYFFSTAVVAFATISAYSWSGFPYDNLCQNGGRVDPNYIGKWTLQTGESGTIVDASVTGKDSAFRYCLQNLLRVEGPSFPAIPANQPQGGEWMTPEQENITNIYGWTSVACIAFVAFTIVWGWSDVIAELFAQKTEHTVVSTKRTFHDVLTHSSISTYTPEVKSNLFPYPLVACNTDDIDDEIYTWTDADHPHSYYDLTKDAEFLVNDSGIHATHAFSSLKHYRPEREYQAYLHGEETSAATPPAVDNRKLPPKNKESSMSERKPPPNNEESSMSERKPLPNNEESSMSDHPSLMEEEEERHSLL